MYPLKSIRLQTEMSRKIAVTMQSAKYSDLPIKDKIIKMSNKVINNFCTNLHPTTLELTSKLNKMYSLTKGKHKIYQKQFRHFYNKFDGKSYFQNFEYTLNSSYKSLKLGNKYQHLKFQLKHFLDNQNKAKLNNLLEKLIFQYTKITDESPQQTAHRYRVGAEKELNNLLAFTKIYLKNKAEKETKSAHIKSASYRDLSSMDSFKRDGWKTLSYLFLPFFPGGFFLMLVPPLMFPRQLLAESFWSQKQLNKFYLKKYSDKLPHFNKVIQDLYKISDNSFNSHHLKTATCRLLLNEIPKNFELVFLKETFENACFLLSKENPINIESVCKILDVNSFGTVEMLDSRLRCKACDLIDLDAKLKFMDLSQLTTDEITQAAYMRGLNAAALSRDANEYWLRNWLSMSGNFNKEQASYYIYAIILQAVNYNEISYQKNIFG